jgi:hypothetical protein
MGEPRIDCQDAGPGFPILVRRTMLELVGAMKESIFTSQREVQDMNLIESLIGIMNDDKLMQFVVKNILPHKHSVINKDINFFIRNQCIFQGLPDDRVKHYTGIIVKIDQDDKEALFDYFTVLIKLVEKSKKMD